MKTYLHYTQAFIIIIMNIDKLMCMFSDDVCTVRHLCHLPLKENYNCHYNNNDNNYTNDHSSR